MLKRFGVPLRPTCDLQVWHAMRFCALNIGKEQREALTKQLTQVREEAKGQSLDLSDMAEASRGVSKQLQDGLKTLQVDDSKFKGKTATLSASLKAYHARLSNLQSEARAIQGEIDGILKLMWGTDAVSQGGSGATTTASSTTNTAKKGSSLDFDCDVPPIAQRLEHMNSEQPAAPTAAPKTPPPKPSKTSEVVEGEVIRSSDKPQQKKSAAASKPSEEIEVESIDIEIEEETSDPSPADNISITDITKDLFERGVNFSDCLDAKSLRQRYRDVLSGKIASKSQAPPKTTSSSASSQQQYNTTQQPPPPPRPQYHQQQYQQQQQTPNTTETNIAHDPYPNAHRKMIDPMKYVWEVKQELAKEKGIDPNSVDLWSGKHKLEDHKRLYDYPSIQSYPIEVRQKGDSPR